MDDNGLLLQPGDQLLSVNGRSLLGLSHGAAVSVLANSSKSGPGPGQLTIAFRRLGRIPVSPLASGSPLTSDHGHDHHQDDEDLDQTEVVTSPNLTPVLQELAMVTEKVMNLFI